MSLLDALLLEPARQGNEIWLANRTDGLSGSGTQQDPYNGGTGFETALSGIVSYSDREFIISTAVDHGYTDGESIHLEVVDPLAPELGGITPFDGEHPITKLTEREFKITLTASPTQAPPRSLVAVVVRRRSSESDALSKADAELSWPVLNFNTGGASHGYDNRELVRVSGAAENGTFPIFKVNSTSFYYSPLLPSAITSPPSTGSATASKMRFLFDEVMRATAPGVVIHIGPGRFLTRGCGEILVPPPGWRPQSGQKIIGSGMGVTTLMLVGASQANIQYYPIDTASNPHDIDRYLDGFEVSDLTIDCNAEGQSTRFMATGAIGLRAGGRHVHIWRVRAINFGTRTPTGYVENYPLAANAPIGRDNYDLVFEDCIAEWPAHNNYWNSTVILLGGGEDPHGDGTASYHRGCAVRNCYVNCEFNFGPKVRIVAVLDYDPDSGSTAVQTALPHGKTAPGNVLVQGLTFNNSFDNLFNGVFAIDPNNPPTDTQLSFLGPAGQSGPPTLAAAATLGGNHPVHALSIESITPDLSHPSDSKLFTVVAREPHYRTNNNNVYISVVELSVPGANPFNGVFALAKVYDPKLPRQLSYRLLQAPSPAAFIIVSAASMNDPYQCLATEPGTAVVVEGNRILHAHVGGPYQDTFTSRDLVTRNNYYFDVSSGPNESRGNLSQWFGTTPLHSLGRLYDTDQSSEDNKKVAVAKTERAHGLVAGTDRVVIADASEDLYNGIKLVNAVPDSTTFEYLLPQPLQGSASSAGYSILDRFQQQYGRRPLESLSVRPLPGMAKWRVTATMAPVPDDGPVTPDKLRQTGLEKGDGVQILNAGFWNAIDQSKFNGFFVVSSIPDDSQFPGSQFEYDLDENPGAIGVDFSPGYFARVWGPKRLVIENNVVELGVTVHGLAGGDKKRASKTDVRSGGIQVEGGDG